MQRADAARCTAVIAALGLPVACGARATAPTTPAIVDPGVNAPPAIAVLDAGAAVARAQVPAKEPEHLRILDVGPAACDLRGATKRFFDINETCSVVPIRRASATREEATAKVAFDSDGCSVWSAGAYAPQAIDAFLDGPERIAAIILVPEMTPSTAHVVHHVDLDLGSLTRRFAAEGSLTTNRAYVVPLGGDPVDHVRVTTTTSPSWVAWRELVLVRCERAPKLPADLTDVATTPSHSMPNKPLDQ